MQSEYIYPKFRWFMLLTLIIGNIAIGIIIICFAPILGNIVKDLGVSVGEIAAATMGTTILACAVSTIVSGLLIDKFGLSKPFIVGGLLMSVSMMLTPYLSASVGELVLLRILMGLGAGPISASVSAVAGKWFPENERGIIAGFVGASMSLGIILGLTVTPKLIEISGNWSTGVSWMAVFPILLLIASIITGFAREPENSNGAEQTADLATLKSDIALAFKLPVTYVGIVSMFLFVWVMNAFNDLTPSYIAISPPMGLGMGPVVAGQFMAAVQIGMLIGSAASGFIMGKLFKGSAKVTAMVGFIFAAVFTFSIKFGFVYSAPVLLFGCLFLVGFFEAFVIPCITTFISLHYPPTITGRLFGTTFGISLFGGSLGVFVGATALHITNSYQLPIIIVSVIALVGFLVSNFLVPPTVFLERS